MDALADEPTREFSLANRKLKLDSAMDVEEFVQVISKISNLTVVSLNGNTLGIEAAKALADALKTHKTITEVNLSDCFTGRLKEEVPVAIESFCKVFMTLPNLIKVDFSDNAFGPVGAKAVYEYLSNASSLQELRLNNNGLGPEGGKLIGEALFNCKQNSVAAGRKAQLRKVFMGRNRLENGSSEALGKAFEAHETLEEIALYQNGIRPDGIVTLSKSLAKCPNITYIDLQDNTFTEKGALEFSNTLANMPKLTYLNIGDCLLGPSGSVKVLDAIFSGPSAIGGSIKHLNLQYNEMDNNGAEMIAKNARQFRNLTQIVLNGNNFNSEGRVAKAIMLAFESAGLSSALDEWDDMEADLDSDTEQDEESSEDASDGDVLAESIEALKIN